MPILIFQLLFGKNVIKELFKYFSEIRNRRLQQEALQHLIQLLPTPNRETLWALLNFLNVVAANSEDQKSETGEWISGNKMDTTNLATVSTTSQLWFLFNIPFRSLDYTLPFLALFFSSRPSLSLLLSFSPSPFSLPLENTW